MSLNTTDKICSSCCCLLIHSMVTDQSATDGATAGVETQCGECFYQWPVAMRCLSQERRTRVCLHKCPRGQMSDWETFCRTEPTGGGRAVQGGLQGKPRGRQTGRRKWRRKRRREWKCGEISRREEKWRRGTKGRDKANTKAMSE